MTTLLKATIQSAGYEKDDNRLQDIRFSIKKGSLIGLIGANGAGKSTTIKSILGLIPFMEGTIDKDDPITISYLPERPIFYDELTLQEHIDFIARVEQYSEEMKAERTLPLLKLLDMDQHVHELPQTYSKGMQQKAMIVLVFMTKPNILIIDEPFIGLDPIATKILINMILEEKENGTGILMSTHVLDTAEKMCDSFIVIDKGRQVADGTLQHLRNTCNMPHSSLLDCFNQLVIGSQNE